MLKTVEADAQPPLAPNGIDAELIVQRNKLLETMRMMKSARFNAHDRLARKSNFSLFTLAMFALYGVGVALYPALFQDRFGKDTLKILTLISIVASIFIIIVAFIGSLNDYRVKGLELQKCAMQVARLTQWLETSQVRTFLELRGYVERYSEIIEACPFSHEDIDYQRALASELERKKEKTPTDYNFIYWRIFRYNFDVYGLYALLLVAPVGLLFLV